MQRYQVQYDDAAIRDAIEPQMVTLDVQYGATCTNNLQISRAAKAVDLRATTFFREDTEDTEAAEVDLASSCKSMWAAYVHPISSAVTTS